jgi:hypothetical protein
MKHFINKEHANKHLIVLFYASCRFYFLSICFYHSQPFWFLHLFLFICFEIFDFTNELFTISLWNLVANAPSFQHFLLMYFFLLCIHQSILRDSLATLIEAKTWTALNVSKERGTKSNYKLFETKTFWRNFISNNITITFYW